MSAYVHSPYGFNCIARPTDGARPPPYHELPPPPPPYKDQQPSWSMPSSATSSPIVRASAAHAPTICAEDLGVTDFCFHGDLARIGCQYVPLPQGLQTPEHWASVDVSHCPRLFVGQVRFEVTVEQLSALITFSCGVVPASVVYHRAGCLIVYLFSEDDRTTVRGLHRRLLFDVHGAWFAHDDAELWGMDGYLQRCAPAEMRRFRLPRGALVIECFHAETKRLAAAAAQQGGSPPSSTAPSPRHQAHHRTAGARLTQPHPQPLFSTVPPPPPHYMSRRRSSGLPSGGDSSSSDDYVAAPRG